MSGGGGGGAGAAAGGTSLAMLVQQRESQNSKKLEALVAKNQELVEANAAAEKEREALLERLGFLDARLVESATVVSQVKRDGDARAQAHDGRMSYLEQGVEERFRLVEDSVDSVRTRLERDAEAAAEKSKEKDMDMALIEKLIVDAMSHAAAGAAQKMEALQEEVKAKDEVILSLHAKVDVLAHRVGGVALQVELRDACAEQRRDMASMQTDVEGTTRNLSQQLEALSRKLLNTEAAARQEAERGQLSVQETLSTMEARLDKVDRLERELASGAATRVVEGRVVTVESTLAQLQTQLIDSVEAAVEGRVRVERVEEKIGGQAAAIGALATAEKEAAVQVRIVKEEQGSAGRRAEERQAELQSMLTQVVQDLSVIDEKRRQREREDAAEQKQRAEAAKLDMLEIRREIELLKDHTPVVDESQLGVLLKELERGKEVMQTILHRDAERQAKEAADAVAAASASVAREVAAGEDDLLFARNKTGAHDAFFLEKTGGLERRLEALEASFDVAADRRPSVPSRSARRESASVSPVRSRRGGNGNGGGGGTGNLSTLGVAGELPPREHAGSAAPAPALQNTQAARAGRPGGRSASPPSSASSAGGGGGGGGARGRSSSGGPAGHGRGRGRGEDAPQAPAAPTSQFSPQRPDSPERPGADEYDPAHEARASFESVYEARHSLVAAATAAAAVEEVSHTPDIKQSMEEKLERARELAAERRHLESELEKVNQHLSFIQMAFQTVAEKEGALHTKSPFFDSVCERLLPMIFRS